MRKSFWIVLALLVVGGAPVAHADTFAPTFTCTVTCTVGVPTAPDVTFPSPTLDITWQGIDFAVIFPSAFQPGDAYTWLIGGINCGPSSCSTLFIIDDLTQHLFEVSSITPVPATFTLGSGTLTFTAVTAPEPSSLALIPLGLGALLLMRRRMGHRRPSVI